MFVPLRKHPSCRHPGLRTEDGKGLVPGYWIARTVVPSRPVLIARFDNFATALRMKHTAPLFLLDQIKHLFKTYV
jgi:hypothetical protein